MRRMFTEEEIKGNDEMLQQLEDKVDNLEGDVVQSEKDILLLKAEDSAIKKNVESINTILGPLSTQVEKNKKNVESINTILGPLSTQVEKNKTDIAQDRNILYKMIEPVVYKTYNVPYNDDRQGIDYWNPSDYSNNRLYAMKTNYSGSEHLTLFIYDATKATSTDGLKIKCETGCAIVLHYNLQEVDYTIYYTDVNKHPNVEVKIYEVG